MITIDLFEALEYAWNALCTEYDVAASLVEIDELLDGVDPSMPDEAAQTVMINLLSSIMECVSRFSPWYKQPASAFGIVLRADPYEWTLAEDAQRNRRVLLDMLEEAIRRNKSVILATRILQDIEQARACQAYICQCIPPRTILIQRSVRLPSPIICDTCHQPFL